MRQKIYGSSLFGMGKDKIIVGLTWSLCGHDYEAKPPINKENWLSHNRLSCPPLHVKPPKLLLLPTWFSEEAFLKRGLISNGNDNDKENKYKYFHWLILYGSWNNYYCFCTKYVYHTGRVIIRRGKWFFPITQPFYSY